MAEISEVVLKAKAAHQAARQMALADTKLKNKALLMIADMLEMNYDEILAANELDLDAAHKKSMAPAMVERLTLTKQRIADIATGVRQVVALPDPVGRVLDEWTRPNGLAIQKITVPIGVIAMIFESRPNVTVDAAVLCIKSGNSCVLRGGSEAIHSNTALAKVIRRGMAAAGLAADAVALIENTDRALVKELLAQRRFIDVAIPRGGAGLIRTVVENSVIPVIETGSGVCHVYVDKDANLDMAVRIIENAKVSRPSTCNAMETLLIHQAVLEPLMKRLAPVMEEQQVELRGDDRTRNCCLQMKAAHEDDWATEYNALIMSVKTVSSLEEAVDHISQYGTKHSETIVTDNKAQAERFMAEVDAAVVYVNASTRFTDGFEFGFGAEIGISTQKLHVRGPMGLEALVSYKYKIHGQGQVR